LKDLFFWAGTMPDLPKPRAADNHDANRELFKRLSFHFFGYLGREKGLAWSTAYCFQRLLYDYLASAPGKRKTIPAFLRLQSRPLEKWIANSLVRFGAIDPVLTLTFLQCIHCFVEYLAWRSVIDRDQMLEIHAACASLALKAQQATTFEVEHLLFDRFPMVPALRPGFQADRSVRNE